VKIREVVIGYQTYTVEQDDDYCAGIDANALTLKDRQRIVYSSTTPKRELADTLMHEILHGICHNYLPDVDRADEEEVVTMIAHGLTQVMRDNPILFKELHKLL
jgi:Zn-dependent peptidase ImmA (M78 family)